MYTHIMIRFGELNTKGKNKIDFINTLFRNIKIILKAHKELVYIKVHDRIYIELHDSDNQEITAKLQNVSGIQSFSLVVKINKNLEEIIATSLKLLPATKDKTFKVNARRADKTFEVHSDTINRSVAGAILRSTELKVDIHNPDFKVNIEVRMEGCYIYFEVIKGNGGFPLGVLGKALLLMSGGIDSPVAGYLLMKRGIKIEAIHFASPPFTSEGALNKVKDLLKQLASIQEHIKLTVIPFTKLQEEIYKGNDESYNITIMRRMMYRIAERVANQNKCLCLASGESLGQVASQTLQSIATINNVISMPMIRPLATFDKLDIIEISKKINTYPISIQPFIDCCTIFTPKNPATKPTDKYAKRIEERINYEPLIEECIANAQVYYINNEVDEEVKDFL